VANGKAAGVRRRAKVIGSREIAGIAGEELELELHFPESAANWLAGFGPDVLVLEPDVLRKSVYERLLAVVGR
jgi:proteasome accessory factor B